MHEPPPPPIIDNYAAVHRLPWQFDFSVSTLLRVIHSHVYLLLNAHSERMAAAYSRVCVYLRSHISGWRESVASSETAFAKYIKCVYNIRRTCAWRVRSVLYTYNEFFRFFKNLTQFFLWINSLNLFISAFRHEWEFLFGGWKAGRNVGQTNSSCQFNSIRED